MVKDDVNAGDLLKSIEKVGGNQLVDLNLFDVYQGDGIEQGYKSLAISLVLQDVEKTLEEQDINATMDLVINTLQQEFSATLRD